MTEGYVVVPPAMLHGTSKSEESGGGPSPKKARWEEASLANHGGDTVRVGEITAQSLAAAVNGQGGGATFTVAEQSSNSGGSESTGVPRIFVMCSGEKGAPLPKRLLVGDVALPVFARQSSTHHSNTTPKDELWALLRRPVLLVGAGGIGCELLKVLVLSGFKHITMIDLDTIDATNLNRQFLFRSSDVGMPKALTARAAVLRWFEARKKAFPQLASEPWAAAPTIVAYHHNVKDEQQFSEEFFRGFAAVLNALDNVSARQHVNRMCMKGNVLLIESGTMGYNGQVQPIVRQQWECYDCRPKPADRQSFAVCTIHARPTTMVHCVHFAKELYETLFGERSLVRAHADLRRRLTGAPSTTTTPDDDGGNGEEVDAGELAYLDVIVKDWLRSGQTRADCGDALYPASLLDFGKALAKCLFHDKIEQLLAMKSSWSTEPPVALDLAVLDAIAQTEGLPTLDASKGISRDGILSVAESVRLFLFAAARCCRRCIARGDGEGPVPFKKEDDLAIDFVASTANLRARSFHIAESSVEELRTIAGAIVPAIATTNAMVAAGVVQQLLQYYKSDGPRGASPGGANMKMVYARKAALVKRRALHHAPLLFSGAVSGGGHGMSTTDATAAAGLPKVRSATAADRFLMYSVTPNLPNPACSVCSGQGPPTVHVTVADGSHATLGDFVRSVLEGELAFSSPSVTFHSRIVYEEEDYEELVDTPLSAFGPGEVTFIVDALNKEVEWRVLVSPRSSDTRKEAGEVSPAAAAAATAFTVSGLQEALAAEEAAVLAAARAAAEEADGVGRTVAGSNEADPHTAAQGAGAGAAGGAGSTATTAIDLDDEEDAPLQGTGAVNTATSGDDSVMEID